MRFKIIDYNNLYEPITKQVIFKVVNTEDYKRDSFSESKEESKDNKVKNNQGYKEVEW